MTEMTSRERYARMFAHREADRVPIIDQPWGATIERWQSEGMPKDADFRDFFGLDRVSPIGVDITPRYPVETVEETDTYRVTRTPWGVTMKNWKHAASTPEYIDFTIVDPDSWAAAKERMTVSRDRVNWDNLEANYATWRERGDWIQGGFYFGFDVTHAQICGTERLLMAMRTDPEWVTDMYETCLNLSIAHFDMIWEAGYTFDCIHWCDDMGYKQNQFFSIDMYRELLLPYQRRAIEWAHAKGIPAHLHSCGDIRPFVPELVNAGLDALNPLEVKAGVDPLALKAEFGDRLVLKGGLNALLWDKPDVIAAEMERVIPALKESGGYICSSDHSVPSSIGLEDFRRIVDHAKRLGSYE